jgi:hypothetical protein
MRSQLSLGAGCVKTALVSIGVGWVLLCPLRTYASSITIVNLVETTDFFHTEVIGDVGLIPDIHFLVDIPGTPWQSSSTIGELPGPLGPFPDVLKVTWTMEHLLGPDIQDVDPNPLGPTSLSLTFIPTAPGSFGPPISPITRSLACQPGGIFTSLTIVHPLTTGGSHFDDFCLEVWGTVKTNILGNLNIGPYFIEYWAAHCDVLDPFAFGCQINPAVGVGGMIESPEPATLILLGTGVLMQALRKRDDPTGDKPK